jgi:hypothetical protein
METKPSPFIFFLNLENSLPNAFYSFDRIFKDLGFILVPVQFDQLQTLMASSDQSQVIVISSVSDTNELKAYNEKIRPRLKFLLKSRRISFIHLSSFGRIDDTKTFAMKKTYSFLKFPLDARVLSSQIARFYEERISKSTRWPGGTRSGVKALAV